MNLNRCLNWRIKKEINPPKVCAGTEMVYYLFFMIKLALSRILCVFTHLRTTLNIYLKTMLLSMIVAFIEINTTTLLLFRATDNFCE